MLITVHARIIYVNGSSSISGDGTSWESAYNDIDSGFVHTDSDDSLYIAKGTYYIGKDTCSVVSGRIFGSFLGNETSPDDRLIEENRTVISGNFLESDSIIAEKLISITEGTLINGISFEHSTKAGIYSFNSNMTIRNCSFSNHNIAIDAVAFANSNSVNSYIYNSIFTNNKSGYEFDGRGRGSVTVRNSSFSGHTSHAIQLGGRGDVTITIHNSTFKDNYRSCVAEGHGGKKVTIDSSSFTNDSAKSVFIEDSDSHNNCKITNSIFKENWSRSVDVQYGVLDILDTKFIGNFNTPVRGKKASFTKCKFEDNSSTHSVVAVLIDTANFSHCTFTKNKSESSYGAVKSEKGSVLKIVHLKIIMSEL